MGGLLQWSSSENSCKDDNGKTVPGYGIIQPGVEGPYLKGENMTGWIEAYVKSLGYNPETFDLEISNLDLSGREATAFRKGWNAACENMKNQIISMVK